MSEIRADHREDPGLITQCLLSKTVGQFKPLTAQNIAMKVNAKMGGNNWFAQPAYNE